MSSRTAAARKRLQDPLLRAHPFERAVNQPKSFAPPSPQADFTSSASPLRDSPRMPTRSFQQLDLSNEFTQPPPSPEYSPAYFPTSNHVKFKNIESTRVVSSYGPSSQMPHPSVTKPKRIGLSHSATTYGPSSHDEQDAHRRRPLLQVDPHGMSYSLLLDYIISTYSHL
jgi:hypothetical protein